MASLPASTSLASVVNLLEQIVHVAHGKVFEQGGQQLQAGVPQLDGEHLGGPLLRRQRFVLAEQPLADLTADEHAHDGSQNPDHNGRVHLSSPSLGMPHEAAYQSQNTGHAGTDTNAIGYLPAGSNFSFSFLP